MMPTMPALFVGHGSPMNALEDNEFTRTWREFGRTLPKPEAILCISAHWLTRGTSVTHTAKPETIHDFGGFPDRLFAVQYPAPGSPAWAERIRDLIADPKIELDEKWGLDHGTWSILKHFYPNADIPVLQLSIDYPQTPQFHYDLGRKLAPLRKQGVLILGSGNVVHNLRLAAFDKIDKPGFGFDWALEMNELFKKHVLSGNHQALIDYSKLGRPAQLSIPTPDHYFPMLYILGLQEKDETPILFNDAAVAGSLTMTSVKFG